LSNIIRAAFDDVNFDVRRGVLLAIGVWWLSWWVLRGYRLLSKGVVCIASSCKMWVKVSLEREGDAAVPFLNR